MLGLRKFIDLKSKDTLCVLCWALSKEELLLISLKLQAPSV